MTLLKQHVRSFCWKRVIALSGAALAGSLIAWRVYELLRYAFLSEHPAWGEVGGLSFVTGLQFIVAAWVAWSAITLGDVSCCALC